MGGVPSAQRALALPWLRPSAAGLLALTDDPPNRAVALDCPGTVAHILRYCRPTPDPSRFALSSEILGQPGICAAAAGFIEHPGAWPKDWSRSREALAPLHFGRRAARVASSLAAETKLCSPDSAWTAALLAPLGRYALVGAEPEPALTPTLIARRLAFRWRLPTAFAVTIGFPELMPNDAASNGGHAGLHEVARAATAAVERLGAGKQIERAETSGPFDTMADRFAAEMVLRSAAQTDPDPGPTILAKLLRATAAARQRGGAAVVADLEAQLDSLSKSLSEARGRFDEAVRDAKLSAMAEFTAGASHEINNPLAVISGNAQLLMGGEADPDRQRRLGAVVRAAGRIHDILLASRQFARPSSPRPEAVAVRNILDAVWDEYRPAAEDRGVRLESPAGIDDRLAANADPGQLRQIVAQLARNAIEAAPSGGSVRATAAADGDRVVIALEDTGPGPAAGDVPHLFDPFFSGRDAGRGRGLGLSVAWQLARLNGGTVAYAPVPAGPTRFTLTLPRAAAAAPSTETPAVERRSA